MDASDIRDEDFNPSNFEDPVQGYHHEQEPVDGQGAHQHQQDDTAGADADAEGQLRQDVLQGLGVSNAAYHFAVAAHTAGAQEEGDLGMGGVMGVEQGVGGGVVGDGVTEDLGYDGLGEGHHQGLTQEEGHGYVVHAEEEDHQQHHPGTGLDDHHLSTNQFPNPDMRLPSIPHSAVGGYDVAYAEHNPGEEEEEHHMDINLDMVGEIDVDTTLASTHANPEQQGTADQGQQVDHHHHHHHHHLMDPSINVSAESGGNREPASGKAPRVRHFVRKNADMTGHGAVDETSYAHDMSDLSASASSRRRTAPHASGHKPTVDDTDSGGGGDGNATAGPSTSVSIDPDTPLSIDEIRRRQNRSRASGKVLPRGGACDFCKRRKLRCDGVRPECGHCAKHVSYHPRGLRVKVWADFRGVAESAVYI